MGGVLLQLFSSLGFLVANPGSSSSSNSSAVSTGNTNDQSAGLDPLGTQSSSAEKDGEGAGGCTAWALAKVGILS